MLNRIREALATAGMPDVPDDASVDLADFGLDSLIIVLSIAELEKTFQIKIPAKDFRPEAFQSLSSLETFLRERGAN